MLRSVFTAGAVAISFGSAASAATVDPVAMLKSFSVIALGNHTLSSDTPSPLYVGGDFKTNGNHSINVNNNLPDGVVGDATGALIVGGSVLAGSAANVKGNVALAGDQGVTQPNPPQLRYFLGNGSEFNLLNNGTTVSDNIDVPASDVAAAFQALAASWASLDGTGGESFGGDSNNPLLKVGAAGADGFAVINLDAADAAYLFGGNTQIQFTGSPVTTIINVAGTSFNNAGKNLNDFAGASNVIFNFYEATDIAINSTFGASIFAPFADIAANSGGANAFMVGYNIDQRYEIRSPFTGNVPGLPDDPSPVPLPAAGWLLIAGLGGLAALGRRHSA